MLGGTDGAERNIFPVISQQNKHKKLQFHTRINEATLYIEDYDNTGEEEEEEEEKSRGKDESQDSYDESDEYSSSDSDHQAKG